MTDMLLDLAMYDAARAARHIDTAQDALTGIVELVADLEQRGHEQAYEYKLASTQAQLRLSELPNWRRTASGQKVSNDYKALLEAAWSADPLGVEGDARSKMVEFMPILLGARADATSRMAGWIGRLGLSREEQKNMIPTSSNPNWDTGLLITSSPEEFAKPSIRLQIKPRNKHSTRYQNGGVTPLSSKSLGFNDPAQIIFSCLSERKELPDDVDISFPLLAPEQLDMVTANIYARTHKSDDV